MHGVPSHNTFNLYTIFLQGLIADNVQVPNDSKEAAALEGRAEPEVNGTLIARKGNPRFVIYNGLACTGAVSILSPRMV